MRSLALAFTGGGIVFAYRAHQLTLAKNRLDEWLKLATMFSQPMALVDCADDGLAGVVDECSGAAEFGCGFAVFAL